MKQNARSPGLAAAALALWCTATAALAQASPWSLRAGPVAVKFNARSAVEVAGSAAPGADITVKDNTTLGLELGYAWSPELTARLAVGAPPTTTLSAGGTLAGYVPPLSGTLGRVKYGPAVLSLTHAFGTAGGIRPYVGAGLNYTFVLSSRDADVAGLTLKDAIGTALQAGVDVPIDGRWSVFVDARQVFVKVKATGTLPALGGPAATANVRLNPLLLNAGVGYRF